MLKKYLHKNAIIYICLISVATATLVFLGNLNRQTQPNETQWQLLKAPESAVELYFTHHESLPNKYTPGSESTISFKMVSYDNSINIYPYEIVQQNDMGEVKVLYKGEAHLETNRTITQEAPIVYTDGGARSKITVRLTNQDQAIHYWVERQQ